MNNNMNEEIKKKLIIDICNFDHISIPDIIWRPIEYYYYKSFFDKLLDDFFNLNNKTVSNLTENETFVLRKKYGLLDDGKALTTKEIASELNVTFSCISQTLLKGYCKLKKSIMKAKQIVVAKDYLEKNQISALLDTDISLLISDNVYTKLSKRCGRSYFKFRYLVKLSSYELLSMSNFGLASVEKLRDLLRQYNLSFANDIAIPENHRINQYDVKKILIDKFEVDKEYYKFINLIVDELYDLRNGNVLSLNKFNTFLIRKICGILDNGIRPSLAQIKEDLGQRYKMEYTYKDLDKFIVSAFSYLQQEFDKNVYNEIMKLSKDEILPIKLRYFKFNKIFSESLINRLKCEKVYTFGDFLDFKKNSNENKEIFQYWRSDELEQYRSDELDQFLVFMVEERELTKEQLEEKRRKEREEQEKKEQERLEKEALIEKRKNELSKARNVLIGQREKIRIEMLRKMDYYDNQLNSVNEKIKKLENK